MLHHGLHEQVINHQLASELAEIPEDRKATASIGEDDAPKILAQYLAGVVQKGLDRVKANGGISAQIELSNQIITLIQNTTKEADFAALCIDQSAKQFLALTRESAHRLADGETAADLSRPKSPIARSSLFTGGTREPQLHDELKKEIASADRIDLLVSFIRWTGLNLLMEGLCKFTGNGGELRIITTTYMGATQPDAIEWLRMLPNTKVKISYNTADMRLHALKAEEKINASDIKFHTVYDPYDYQKEVLAKLKADRVFHKDLGDDHRGHHRNLVVAATGTEKTAISAFNYRDFCKANPDKPCRLLFVAHRKEILEQSLSIFRSVMKNDSFGELYVGGYKSERFDNLFISIQAFSSQDFVTKTSPEFYDFIIMDEIHHAAAPSYGKLLDYYKPEILLGITAAPERMDGKDILPYFNNRIVAEIRLPGAITAGLLCPFHLFRIADDTVDLRKLKWSAGGYDKRELSNAYTESGSISKRYCPTTFVQGALWLLDKQLDVFLITLRKEKKLLFHNYVQRLFHR